jgi:hypothetical protein
MLRLTILGLAAIAVGLVGGWSFLKVQAAQPSATTSPGPSTARWEPSDPVPSSRADEVAAPAVTTPRAIPVPTAAPTPTPPVRTAVAPAPAKPVAAPQAMPKPAVVKHAEKRGRTNHRRKEDDDD